MALLTWDNKYSVGVKSIDGQHSVLFGLINDLHAAMLKGEAQNVAGPLLKKLADYTQTHFSEEERMMAASKYPDLVAHKAKHQELLRKVGEFAARFERNEVTLTLDLMNFLRDWLTNHIQKVDHAYSPWMTQHGVK